MRILVTVIFMIIILTTCGAAAASEPLNMNPEKIELEGKWLMGYIEVPGGKVWYGIVGADKHGVPLLVLHGGPGMPHDYLENLSALADERPVVFYDQLGCGNSDRPHDDSLWNIERFVTELAIVREKLSLNKVHILGQSWGSMLAVEYMLTRQPTGVCSLVLSGPALSSEMFVQGARSYLKDLPDDAQKAIYDAEANGDYKNPAYQKAVQLFFAKHVCRLSVMPEEVIRGTKKMGSEVYEYMWGQSEFSANGSLKDFDRTKDLHKITQPVFLLSGQFDEAVPTSAAYYCEQFPHASLLVLADASHMHSVEKPKEFLAAVRQFLHVQDECTETIK